MSAALHTVHVRINDAATGQPTPLRLRITDADGVYYAPLGRLTDFALGPNEDVGGNVRIDGRPYAYIDGQCEIRLPAGRLLVEVSKGPEYQPLEREITLGVGRLALRLTIERWINLRKDGWYSGDTRAEFMTPHAALLEAAAEDLGVVNLLARSTRIVTGDGSAAGGQASAPSVPSFCPAITNILAFSGQRPALETARYLVVVNTRNSHPVLGSLGLLNCHRPVYPLSFGGPDGPEDWSLADWCDQCHRKGGLVIGVEMWQKDTGFHPGEVLADLILGKVDALEVGPSGPMTLDGLADWYGLLNAGFRVPLVGGSGKDSNRILLGGMRTYARVPPSEEFTYQKWIEAVRAGRTGVSNGPLVSFTVNGDDPGATILVGSTGSTVRVHVEARSASPFGQLELLANGAVIAHAPASGSPASARLDLDVPFRESGWLAVRCCGQEQPSVRETARPVFAHTAPVYVDLEGRPRPRDPGAVSKLLGHLEDVLGWVEHEGRFTNDHHRQNLVDIFQHARAELVKRPEHQQEGRLP